MIKLKQVINESIAKVESFRQEVERANIDTRIKVFRGVSGARNNTATWKKVKIRKDRNPLDTSRKNDIFLEAARQASYPNKPSRREVAFGTSYKNVADQYGDVYRVFWPGNAQIWVAEVDTYNDYTSNIDLTNFFATGHRLVIYYSAIMKNVEELGKMKNELDPFFNLIDASVMNDYDNLFKEVKKNYHYYKEAKKYREKVIKLWETVLKGSIENQKISSAVENHLPRALRAIYRNYKIVENYFDAIHKWRAGGDPSSTFYQEFFIKSDYIYLVNTKWYKTHFEKK